MQYSRANNRLSSFLFALLIACGTTASAEKTSLSANTTGWLKIPFKEKNYFSELYKNGMAEGIFIRTTREGFLPPIQYLTRPVQSDLANETKNLSQAILNSIGAVANAKNPSKHGPLKVGENRQLRATFAEYLSSDSGEPVVTCMIFVRKGKLLHAIYTSAFRASLPDCSKQIAKLARSTYLLN